MVKVNNRCVFSNANEREEEKDSLYSRNLRSAAAVKLLFVASFRLVGNDFRPRGPNDVDGEDSPLSYAYFHNCVNCSFLFTVMDLQSDEIWFI